MCGSDKELDFDHIDPKTKKFNVSQIYTHGLNILTAELDKCQLLCRDCHIEKTIKERLKGESSHGRYTTYINHKCRCESCRLAYNKWMRVYVKNYRLGKKLNTL